MSEQPCMACSAAIGYGREYYEVDEEGEFRGAGEPANGRPTRYARRVHADCLEVQP